jgi:curved DNA-binding protein CbpA
MDSGQEIDWYEALQVSVNAEVDTIQRIYRLLAQRFHPDNQSTGNAERFRQITEAYQVLSDPERRARYDATRPQRTMERAQLLSETVRVETDLQAEQLVRLTVLEILYARRRLEPRTPGLYDGELEELLGRPREHLEFPLWYLGQKGYIDRPDGSRIVITVDGVDYLEAQSDAIKRVRRLAPPAENGTATTGVTTP